MNPFVNISPPPDDDRRRSGTKAERRNHVPIGIRVRYAISMLIGVLSLYAAGGAYFTSHRLSSDEKRTCQLQQIGLPAGHELAASMKDIHALLTISPVVHVLPQTRLVVADLDAHLVRYLASEAQQPRTRHC